MKNSTEIFEKALQLQLPWEVQCVTFKKGSKFKDKIGNESNVHDTIERSWQYLNFFQHQCFITAKVPRIKTNTGQVETVAVPWARGGSGFTLLFEAYAIIKVAKTLKAHWTGLVNFAKSKINNGILEGINSKIQLAKKRARGFRNSDNFISMIYFIAGKLKFDYPLYSS